jgi:hypothetical protein
MINKNFLKKQCEEWYQKNAEFDADFESVGKIVKKR